MKVLIKKIINEHIYDFSSPGVGLSYFNVDESIHEFALSCFNFSLNRGIPLYLSTKNTILKQYDEKFKKTFDELYEKKYKKKFLEKNISYQHRLIEIYYNDQLYEELVVMLIKLSLQDYYEKKY